MAHFFIGLCCMLVVATCVRGVEHCGYIPGEPDSKHYGDAHGTEEGCVSSLETIVLNLLQTPIRRPSTNKKNVTPVLNTASKQFLLPGEAFVAYKHAHLMQKLMGQKQIVAWATGGTLLGAIRNGGIIPHDNDCDFSIFEKDLDDALEAINSSMSVKKNDGGVHYETYYTDTYDGSNYTSQVDLFVAEWLFNSGIESIPDPSTVALQDQFTNRSAQLEFTRSLVSKQFGCSTVMVPSQVVSKQYLDMQYGTDWAEHVSCNGTWHGCSLLDDMDFDLNNMSLPCYDVDDGLSSD